MRKLDNRYSEVKIYYSVHLESWIQKLAAMSNPVLQSPGLSGTDFSSILIQILGSPVALRLVRWTPGSSILAPVVRKPI